MVWIHGDAYEIGGTAEPSQEGSNFVKENPDVILVSIGYRLGAYGFLHLSHLPDGQDYPDAQNLGIMDNEMALKLVESYEKDVKESEPDYTGDRLFDQLVFFAPLIRISENQTMGGGTSYTYLFTPESSIPLIKCGHALELSTVFNRPEENQYTGRIFDETFSKTLRRMWVQFVKTGNPSLTAEQSPDGEAKEWPAYDLENKWIMVLDEFDIHPEKESERKLIDWDRTYFLTKYYCI